MSLDSNCDKKTQTQQIASGKEANGIYFISIFR